MPCRTTTPCLTGRPMDGLGGIRRTARVGTIGHDVEPDGSADSRDGLRPAHRAAGRDGAATGEEPDGGPSQQNSPFYRPRPAGLAWIGGQEDLSLTDRSPQQRALVEYPDSDVWSCHSAARPVWSARGQAWRTAESRELQRRARTVPSEAPSANRADHARVWRTDIIRAVTRFERGASC